MFQPLIFESLGGVSREADRVLKCLNKAVAVNTDSSEQEVATDFSALLKPDLLKGLTQAVDLLLEALHTRQKIVVVGDFDADGATSSALAVMALSAMGAKGVEFLVPNRFEYGYGLTPEIVEIWLH